MSKPEIRAILFDAAGTLIHLRESVGESYSRVAKSHGIKLDPGITDSSFQSIWRAMPPLGSQDGTSGERSEKAWWRTLVDLVLDEQNVPSGTIRDGYFEDLFQSYASPTAWRPYPETPDVLDAITRRGLRLAVLSNFDSRLIPVLDGLGLSSRFDEIFFSGKIGHAKPSPEIFGHAVAALRLRPDECLHVGDDPDCDWAGARAAGLQAFELDRSKHDLSSLLELPNLPDFSN